MKSIVYSIGGLVREYNNFLATEAYLLFNAYCIENGVCDNVDYILDDKGNKYTLISAEVKLAKVDRFGYAELTQII